MGDSAEERRVFTAFLSVAPLFAGAAIIDWRQPTKDPPDIDCDLEDGRKVGVELTSWLDESQIGSEKKVETSSPPSAVRSNLNRPIKLTYSHSVADSEVPHATRRRSGVQNGTAGVDRGYR